MLDALNLETFGLQRKCQDVVQFGIDISLLMCIFVYRIVKVGHGDQGNETKCETKTQCSLSQGWTVAWSWTGDVAAIPAL